MPSETSETKVLIGRIKDGDERAMVELFARYRGRLRRMVKLRIDRRLQGRLDPSDVLQDAYMDVAKRAGEYRANPTMPVFLWLRLLTGQKLMALHRKHLGAQMRDAGQEVSLHGAWNSFSPPFPGKEWTVSLAALADGTLKWEFMITHELPLSELPRMFERIRGRNEHFSKVMFRP